MLIKDLIKKIIEEKVLNPEDLISEFTMHISGDIALDGTKLNFNDANISYNAAMADAYRHEHEVPDHCRYTIEMKGQVIWWRDIPGKDHKQIISEPISGKFSNVITNAVQENTKGQRVS